MYKVLFQNRADALINRGGDTTQMIQTREELIKLGHKVDISLEAEPELTRYDLVHIFNIQTSDYGIKQMRNAKKYGVPVALSTIYWDMRNINNREFLMRYHRRSLVRQSANVHWRIPYAFLSFYHPLGIIREYNFEREKHKLAREMLYQANVLLPNSYAELEILAMLFDAPWVRAKSFMVPNGISVSSKQALTEQTPKVIDNSLPPEYVLQVGRIEPVKGQLMTITALLDHPEVPMVFIGKPTNQVYWEQCMKLGKKRGNTWFLDEVAHETLQCFYERAKVHVLPSLRESPGLVTLEAALHGTNCVVSYYGPVTEYFGNDVWYCDPYDSDSIKKAILKAWLAPISTNLKERIVQKFTWHEAAIKTLEGYKQALSQ